MTGTHVLVIDDDEQMTTFLRRALAYAGFTVDAATTAEAGLQLARGRLPAVVVLDVPLPDLDGLTVCRRLRMMGDLHILLLTARAPADAGQPTLVIGADDYLPKPFALADLIARLHTLAAD